MKLLNQEYNKLEDEFIARYLRKMRIGHCSNEAAIRQTFGDVLEKIGVIECGKMVIMDPNARVLVEFTD